MLGWIHGITVKLHIKTKTGEDAFGMDTYTDDVIDIPNVIVSPTTDAEILNEMQMYGKHSTYTLCIPKGDMNDWNNTDVEFFGRTWHTFADTIDYIDDLVPLSWNKKVKVEIYE